MDEGAPIPVPAVPIPGGGPTDLMLNPEQVFPTRFPGAPVETYSGAGFINSGIFSEVSPAPGIPPNDTMSVTFDTPGIYPYLCLVHPGSMFGSVVVLPPGAPAPFQADTQADIDTRADKESARLQARIDLARQQTEGRDPISLRLPTDPAPGGTNVVFVKAGATEMITADFNTQILEFFPQDLTIKAGDTVVWGSDYFHGITFDPSPTPAEFVIPEPQAQGPPILRLNDDVFLAAKPSAVFDASQYFNSADLGPFSPAGNSWSLTFDTPGRYEYFCVFHRQLGMEGTITVTAP